MYIIAIHQVSGDLASYAQDLAKILSKTAYEMRPRLNAAQTGPAIIANFSDLESARACIEQVRALGLSALALDMTQTYEQPFLVRKFDLSSKTLLVVNRQEQQKAISYSSIELILRGMTSSTSSETTTTRKKKLSMGRAVLSGGLMLRKTVKKTSTTNMQSRELFFQLYTTAGHFLFQENTLLYESLGTSMQPSRMANLLFLLQYIRKSCPATTLYDERLLRTIGAKQILGSHFQVEQDYQIAMQMLEKAMLL